MQKIIYITGTHCSACKKLIERKIGAIDGVTSVLVNYESGKTVIESNIQVEKKEIDKVLEGMPYAQKN